MNNNKKNALIAKRQSKKGVVIFTLVFLLVTAVCFFIPHALVALTPEIEVIVPVKGESSVDIYIDGVVEQQSKKDIVTALPIVPEEIMVSVGDRVKKNDVIATVDAAATQAAIFSLVDASKLIPQEYIETIGGLAMAVTDEAVSSKIPSSLKSPADGVITAMTLVKGAISTPTQAVCTISMLDELRINMNVGESDAAMVSEGDRVSFTAFATKDKEYFGTVTRIFPAAQKVLVGTAQKTVVGMYIQPDERYEQLKPGYTVSGAILPKTQNECLTLPYEVIAQDDSNNEFVYCYENSRAVKKYIKTGEEFAAGVEILEGLSQHDRVIKNPQAIKEENSLVRPIKNK